MQLCSFKSQSNFRIFFLITHKTRDKDMNVSSSSFSSRATHQDVTILTKDNYLLSAKVYEPSTPPTSDRFKKTAIVGSAIGVKMSFYHDFACFLQQSRLMMLSGHIFRIWILHVMKY